MAGMQIRGTTQILAGSIVDAQIGAGAAIATSKLADGANFVKRDGSVAMTGALNMGSQLISSLATPVSATDAATKAYVDSTAQGLSAKGSARAASTANVTVSNPGTAVFDGVALANGDRLLLKNQTTGSENGIYVFNGSGAALTRAADSSTGAQLAEGAYVFVEEGTANAATGWVQTTSGALTIGTTTITWTQFNGAGQVTAGNGISKTGTTISAVGDGNNGIQVAAAGIQIKLDPATGNPLTLSSAGLKVALASASILVGNGSGNAAPVAMSGDVTMLNTGATTVNTNTSTGFLKYANWIPEEALAGTVNGTNTAFTVAHAPASTPILFQNGIRLRSGAGNDFTYSGSAVTFATAPTTGDVLLATYAW